MYGPSRFPVLRLMGALKAAREFGLDAEYASEVAARFDPGAGNTDQLVDALADALLERGAVSFPDAV